MNCEAQEKTSCYSIAVLQVLVPLPVWVCVVQSSPIIIESVSGLVSSKDDNWSVAPLLWYRLKDPDSFRTGCFSILYGHSWFPEDEACWLWWYNTKYIIKIPGGKLGATVHKGQTSCGTIEKVIHISRHYKIWKEHCTIMNTLCKH